MTKDIGADGLIFSIENQSIWNCMIRVTFPMILSLNERLYEVAHQHHRWAMHIFSLTSKPTQLVNFVLILQSDKAFFFSSSFGYYFLNPEKVRERNSSNRWRHVLAPWNSSEEHHFRALLEESSERITLSSRCQHSYEHEVSRSHDRFLNLVLNTTSTIILHGKPCTYSILCMTSRMRIDVHGVNDHQWIVALWCCSIFHYKESSKSNWNSSYCFWCKLFGMMIG